MRSPQRPQTARPCSSAGLRGRDRRRGRCRARSALASERAQVALVLLEGDVSGVRVGDQASIASRGTARVAVLPLGGLAGRGRGHTRTRRHSGVVQDSQARASGSAAIQTSSPLRSPVRIRAGNSSPSRLNACTTARAEPVLAKRGKQVPRSRAARRRRGRARPSRPSPRPGRRAAASAALRAGPWTGSRRAAGRG